MDFPDNQLVLHKYNVEMGPHMQRQYTATVDADLTDDRGKGWALTDDIEQYLNQYFAGWRLLRRVEEKRAHASATRFKTVYFVLVLGTDADAETVKSRLLKDGYVPPAERVISRLKSTPITIIPSSRPLRIIQP